MQRALKALAVAPSKATYLAAFEAFFRSSPPLGPAEISLLEMISQTGDHTAFTETLKNLSPLVALSPAVHVLALDSARRAADEEDAELEAFLLDVCLSGILATGDGSAESPYLVVCAADERHVCRALGLEPGPQALVNHSGRSLDVVQCLDGTDVWFNVSPQVPLPATQPLVRKSAKCASRPRRKLTQTPR